LRSKFIRLIVIAGNNLAQTDQWEKAVEHYRKALEIDTLAEEFYQHLMICHQELGQSAEAVTVYDLCRSALSSSLAAEPSQRTKEIYNQVRQKR
jgi:LuxR family maltose regulon positive regulatory protein